MIPQCFESLEHARCFVWQRNELRCVALRFADGCHIFVGLEAADGPWMVCEDWRPDGFGNGAAVFIQSAELHKSVVFAELGNTGASWTSVYALKRMWIVNREDAFREDILLSMPVS